MCIAHPKVKHLHLDMWKIRFKNVLLFQFAIDAYKNKKAKTTFQNLVHAPCDLISQVKVPKYNCPKDLYSDTTMDEMISGTSQIE